LQLSSHALAFPQSLSDEPARSALVRAASKAFVSLLRGENLEQLWATFFFAPQAQDSGGGDSGGGDGGSGDSGGSDSGSGDSSSSDDGGDVATSEDVASVDAVAVDAVAVAVTSDPTDPTTENNAVTPELAAIMSIPTTDPRGGEDLSSSPNFGLASPDGTVGGPLAPGGGRGDVTINAVIVSGAANPWDAVVKGPGVRSIRIKGGVIALGETPLPGENLNPSFYLIPDLRYLNGLIFPPIVPNVIDVRTMSNAIQAQVENPEK
jgi:hypothetical protein